MKLSICIPTFNRRDKITNCLNSIYIASSNSKLAFEVCISDNGSDYDIIDIIREFDNKLQIKVNKNKSNIGYMANLLKVISLAEGEFVWAIGDDDILMPHSLIKLEELFKKNINHDEMPSRCQLRDTHWSYKNSKSRGVNTQYFQGQCTEWCPGTGECLTHDDVLSKEVLRIQQKVALKRSNKEKKFTSCKKCLHADS